MNEHWASVINRITDTGGAKWGFAALALIVIAVAVTAVTLAFLIPGAATLILGKMIGSFAGR